MVMGDIAAVGPTVVGVSVLMDGPGLAAALVVAAVVSRASLFGSERFQGLNIHHPFFLQRISQIMTLSSKSQLLILKLDNSLGLLLKEPSD